MLLFCILLVSIFSFISLVTRKPKTAMALLAVQVLLFWLFGSGFTVDFLLNDLQSHPPLHKVEWKTKNLIVLLASGQAEWKNFNFIDSKTYGLNRTLEAYRLYRNCAETKSQCHILAVGGDPSHTGTAEADSMVLKLKELGVAETDLIKETESRNTIENAKLSAPLIQNEKAEQVILVTSAFHMQRSIICFSQYGIENMLAAPTDYLNGVNTFYPHALNLYLSNLAFHEYAGIIQALAKL